MAGLCLALSVAAEASAEFDELEPVSIELKWLHQFQFAGFYAALEQGYFAEEGLDVRLYERNFERNQLQAVISGEVDYGVGGSQLLLDYAQGKPVALLAAILQHSAVALISKESSGLTRPEQLSDRTVGVFSREADVLGVLALLAGEGLGERNLVRMHTDWRAEALLDDQFDAMAAYVSNTPYELKQRGVAFNLIWPQHYGLDFYGDILFTSQQKISQQPQQAEKVRRAVIRGWHYALANPDELIDLILEKYNTQNKSRGALTFEAGIIHELIGPNSIPIGTLDAGRIAHITRTLTRLGVLTSMHDGYPGLKAAIYNDYSPWLSPDEQAFLQSLDTVRVGVERRGWPPFEFFDHQQQYLGIASDYLALIGEMLDIEFEIISDADWDEVIDRAKRRDIDLLSAAASTPQRRRYMNFTEPYAHSPMVIVTRDSVAFVASLSDVLDWKVGVVAGYASDDLLTRFYPSLELQRYSDTESGLRALAAGDLDGFIDNLAVVSYVIRRDGLANLKISGTTPYNFDLGLAVRNDWPLLHSALNKALLAISHQQRTEIYEQWVRIDVNNQTNWIALAPFLLGAAGFMLLLGFYTFRLRVFNQRIQRANHDLAHAQAELFDKNVQLEQLSVTDKLTGAYNRYHLDAVLTESLARAQRYHRDLAVVLFDLDWFKQVNDRHGHQAGDAVLCYFTDLVRRNIRQSDVFGRWGGEEFLLVCPETSAMEAARVADKIRQQLSAHRMPCGHVQTVSAGVADIRENHTVDQLILYADQQLYRAKQSGRNKICSAAADLSGP